MLFLEKYNEIKADSKGYYTEKKSRFIGYCFLVHSKKDVITKLNNLKKREKGANHYCFAYIINIDQSEQKMFDDGEPNSTAGKPILQQIKSLELTNILIVVVRYFGGTKLGIPGLIKAYKSAARNSLKNTENIYLAIYDLLGREIYTIHDGQQRSGNHNVQCPGINNQGDLAPSGVYFCRLKTEAEVLTKKMVLNR